MGPAGWDALIRLGELAVVAAAAWGSIRVEVRNMNRWLADHENRLRYLERRKDHG